MRRDTVCKKRNFPETFPGSALIGIYLLFFVTRLWQLTDLPFGIHVDEAGMAYDAWCLSQYGVDRYLKSWPVYLTNFGGGQSSMYAFLCAFLFRIFGFHLWLARIPAVLFSFLNLVFGIKLVRKLYPGNEWLSLVTGGLLTICPYFIMAGRFALDCNLMLGMSTIFLYCLIQALEDSRLGYYFLAGLTGGLVLYTYALSYIILPLFLAVFILYVLRSRRLLLRGWGILAIPMGLLALPLILVQLVNFFGWEEFRLGCFTITKLQFYRAGEIGRFRISGLVQALQSVFIGDPLPYNSLPSYFNLYGITIVFFGLGFAVGLRKFFISIRKRTLDFVAIPIIWFVCVIFFEAHIDSNTNKINGIFCSVVIITVVGLDAFARLCRKIGASSIFEKKSGKNYSRFISSGIPAVVICFYLLCFGDFFIYYFGGAYTADTYILPYFHIPFSEAVEIIDQDSVLCKKETQVLEPKIVYAVSSLVPPHILKIWEKNEEWEQFGCYRFGGLGLVDDQCSYIVRDGYEEYCNELRACGFEEKRFEGYSLFYKK